MRKAGFIILLFSIFSGSQVEAITFTRPVYYPIEENSNNPSSPTSTPTVTPTHTPTPKPTSKPTTKPTQKPTSKPTPTIEAHNSSQPLPTQSIVKAKGENQTPTASPTKKHSKNEKSDTTASSLFSNSTISTFLTNILPALIGGIGAILAGIFGWGMLKKKNSTFANYIKRIEDVEKDYVSASQNQISNLEVLKANHRQMLEKIQEDAETQAAMKKLTQEHLSAIVNRIQRHVKKIDESSVKKKRH